MTLLHDRRNFLTTVAAAAAGGAMAQGSVPASGVEQTRRRVTKRVNKHIKYHYEEPFDYKVMQGLNIGDDKFVGKNNDLPTCFFADQTRMRWALQHMSVLQRTLPIARSGDVVEFDYRPVDLGGVKVETGEGKQIGVPEWLALTETDAFMAVYLSRDAGPIVATEQYFNGMKPHSLHYLWSMSKSLAVGVVAIALEQGKLNREQTIGELLPELAKTGLSDATLDNVLNMASGAKLYGGNKWTFEGLVDFVMNRAFVAYDFLDSDKADPAIRDLGMMTFLQTIEKEKGREHGRAFDYKDVDSRSAVAAVERAFGRPFHELFTDLIWSRIGAEHDAFICCDQYGSAATPYGFSATLRDCARWGLCHLSGSPRSILPDSFVQNLVTPHPTYSSEESRRFNQIEGKAYRDQYWVFQSDSTDGFYAGGWMGQRIHVFPRLSVVIVQLATCWEDGQDKYETLVPGGPAFTQLAEHVAKAYREKGL